MTLIYRLILKQWFQFFIGAAFILIILLSIGNILTGLLRGNVTPLEVVINHFLYLPSQMNQILPVSVLIASLFSVNKLINRNELTAIFALGFSRKKFLFTISQASILIAILHIFISGFIQPYALEVGRHLIKNSEKKFRNFKKIGLKANTIASGLTWYKSDQYFFSFSTFNQQTNLLNKFSIYYFNKDNKISKIYKASVAQFIGKEQWLLKNGEELSKLTNNSFLNAKKFKTKEIYFAESPRDFAHIESDITALNIFKLYDYIEILKESGINTNGFEVMLYDKFSTGLICIIFSLLGAISIFNPNRRAHSFGKTIAIVIGFALIYWLFNSYTLELGKNNKISPIIATFGSSFLFIIYLIQYIYKNRKIS